MPNWKKVITSGSDAALNKLIVDGSIGHVSASLFSGSFYGDGSNLTGIAGGTDTNIANTDLTATANRTLDMGTNDLTISASQYFIDTNGGTFEVDTRNGNFRVKSDTGHNIYLEGLTNTETPNIVGYNTTTGKLSYYSTSSFSGGGGSTAHTPDVYQIDTATITSTNTLLTFAGTGNPTIISGSSGTTRTAEATDSITFNSTGIFEISYSVQMQQGASSATDVRMNPQVYARFGESGGELTVAAGSSSVAYIRLLGSNQAPNGGCTCTFYIDVTNKFHILELLVAFTQPATNIDLDIVQFESVPNALSIRKLS